MLKAVECLLKPRLFILDRVNDLTLEQYNQIPRGFNNNIIWNLGHMVAGHQSVCYARAGRPITVSQSFHSTFKPDSKPEKWFTIDDVAEVKTHLISTLFQFEKDLQLDYFSEYSPFNNRFGCSINGIDDAVRFITHHDGIHLGTIRMMQKMVEV